MTPKRKLQFSILVNIVILLFIGFLMGVYASDSEYWRVGWHDGLVVISVRINTGLRYFALVILISLVNMASAISERIGEPIIDFSVYNPDKHNINDFTRPELLIYSVIIPMMAEVRNVFVILISITQADITLWNIVFTILIAVVTATALLSEKTFNRTRAQLDFLQMQEGLTAGEFPEIDQV